MAFRIIGLEIGAFAPLFSLSDDDLVELGARRQVATDAKPGFPCRVTLEEAEPGERLLLVNHQHQGAHSPYRSAHAIYVREVARETFDKVDVVPDLMRSRLLSVRAFDPEGMMVDAEVVDGVEAESLIARLLENPKAAYLHVHFAKRGCFAARVERG